MGDLPESRVCPSTVFQNTGIDFAGPFLVRSSRGSRNTKCYICVFVCFATKAVHLETIDSQKIEELNQKLKWAKGETTHAKNRAHEVEREKKLEMDKLEFQIIALQQECSNLKIEVNGLKSEKTEIVRKLNIEIGRLELRVSMLQEEAQKSTDYIEVLKRKNIELTDKAALCSSLEKELNDTQARIKSLENKIEADKDAALIVANRQAELKLLSELKKENQVLKEKVAKNKETNVLLYQEKLWSYQEKLKQAERKISVCTKLQGENEQLKAKLSQWEDLFDDEKTPYKSPTAFSRKLSQYQKNEAVLTNKLSQLSNHCETVEKQKKELEESNKVLNHRLTQFQVHSPRQDSIIKRLQRKVIFLTKERDNCRKLLDSYLSESTISGLAVSAEQISQLEDLNMEYKRALEKSEIEIDNLNDKLKCMAENSNSEALMSDLKKLREENSSLAAQISDLHSKKVALEKKMANQVTSENNDGWSGRVLHLKLNPSDNANRNHLAAFHKLQEENDALKKRIKVLEEEGIAASDVTMKVQQKLATEGADSTLKSLREQLAAAERQQRFILENAGIKSTEFREAVYRLLGFRIDVPTSETYKLSHMYADSRDDYLLFQINSEGIQLIETEYSKQITDKVEVYLLQHDSFPAFFASLTMELFNQQTCMQNSHC
ncbi:mitotic spindle assembly checkpoint protein MAD1-like [Uloborus diversus]|uniref:mitotic spindle assembly checkpoint protein MAD1-like n=1 Tax=Uloborus diversus TaxID=327109 RepID=UPI00240A5D7F|nr:mitotic spindle assembly checkpoint protein MAD1-like [Uloborus diversus]